MVTLEKVVIPGYAEAVRKESQVRDTAFLDGLEAVCGVGVRPICLRRLIWLEQARNGLVVPWRFDTEEELLAASLQVVYFCRPEFSPPASAEYSFVRAFMEGCRQNRFFRRVLGSNTNKDIIEEVRQWLADAFMDAPAGSATALAPSYAGYPAYIVDKFAEAGLPFSYAEIMDMPLKRLWQHWRVAMKRCSDVALTNPSDDIRVAYLAGGNR
jgi:hypothetical protein